MKLKSKILFPIVGVTALSASVAPALVGCNNKAEKQTYVVHIQDEGEKYTDWHAVFDGNFEIEAEKNKDVTVTVNWTPNQEALDFGIAKLYAYKKVILVDNKEIPTASKGIHGYHIDKEQENQLQITIDKECFVGKYDKKKPLIIFQLAFARDEIDQNVSIDHFAQKYFTVDDVDYDCLLSQTVSITVPEDETHTSVELSADLNKWNENVEASRIPKTNYIYLALVSNGGIVKLQETGTVYLGVTQLVSHITSAGYMIIEAPKNAEGEFIGWGEIGKLQPLRLYIDFFKNYDGIEFALAEPNADVMSVDSKITNTNDFLLDWDPEFMNCSPYYDGSNFYETTIAWNTEGFADRLYAAGKVIKVNGVTVPVASAPRANDGYTVENELSSKNQFSILIPKSFMSPVDNKIKLALELYMNRSYINDDITLDNFSNQLTISELGTCSGLGIESLSIKGGEAIKFHVPLMNWGGPSSENTTIPTNKFFLLGLFEQNGTPIPLTRTGTVYYGSTQLHTDINNGYMMIYAPSAGWGTSTTDLSEINVWMEFLNDHTDAKVVLFQPNTQYTPFKMNFVDTGSIFVAEPIVKYSTLITPVGSSIFETKVQLVPQGINNVIIPNYSVILENAVEGPRTLEEGKDYTVKGFDNNSKTFVFASEAYAGIETPEFTIRGNVQNPSVTTFDGAMSHYSADHAGYECLYSDEFAVATIPLIRPNVYVESQIQLFNWGGSLTKIEDLNVIEVQLWDYYYDRQIDINQVGGSGIFDDNSVYYRQNNTELDYEISDDGHILIYKPNEGWGSLPGTIHFSIQFTTDHSRLELRAFPHKA